jgi:alpha-beta hydrolase superfamily lysophospholipase
VATLERKFSFTGADGAPIAGFCWLDDRVTPRAVLQVAHGMGEHARRYRAPLEPLIAAGWAVYANDNRGHGLTASDPEQLGDFGENGAELVIEDLHNLTSIARGAHPDLPIVLLGHSLGSFFAQAYVFDHSQAIDGLVLSGTVAAPSAAWMRSALMAKRLARPSTGSPEIPPRLTPTSPIRSAASPARPTARAPSPASPSG